MGHSFNGITISRVAELHPEKTEKLVYLTAFLLPEGGSFFKAVSGVEGSKAVENFYLTENEEYALVKEAEMQNPFAHDIPLEAFEAAKPSIVPEPLVHLGYELEITDKNFGMLPKYYIDMYKGKVEKVFSLDASHTPNFSQPWELAKLLLEIAGL